MAVVIAGREVRKDDRLFHIGFNAWGIIEALEGLNIAIFVLTNSKGQVRKLRVSTGGIINGTRSLYWHEPLMLDLPVQNVAKYQNILDALVTEFSP